MQDELQYLIEQKYSQGNQVRDTRESHISFQENGLDDLAQQLASSQTEVQDLKASVEALRGDQTTETLAQEEYLVALKGQVASLQCEIAIAQKEKLKDSVEMDSLRQLIPELDALRFSHEAQSLELGISLEACALVQQSLEKATACQKELEQEITRFKLSAERDASEVSELRAEGDRLTTQVEQNSIEVANLQGRLERLLKQEVETQTELKAVRDLLVTRESHISFQENGLDDLAQQLASSQTEVQDLKASVEAVEEKLLTMTSLLKQVKTVFVNQKYNLKTYDYVNFTDFYRQFDPEPDSVLLQIQELDQTRIEILRGLKLRKALRKTTGLLFDDSILEMLYILEDQDVVGAISQQFQIEFQNTELFYQCFANFLKTKFNVAMEKFLYAFLDDIFASVAPKYISSLGESDVTSFRQLFQVCFQLLLLGYRRGKPTAAEGKVIVFPQLILAGSKSISALQIRVEDLAE
eukprot:EST43537.1 Hypothetical protein SS50377_16572 [Spironucleus salmonicida]